MKKTSLFFMVMSFIAISLLNSCSQDREFENANSLDSKKNMARTMDVKDSSCEYFEAAQESSILQGVKATYIDNGISTTCSNNILIFPTLQEYENAIGKLDELIEQHNDAFDQQTANMTDEESDNYADAIGFDEDQPLTDFEKELDFCSLRSYLIPLEDNWLDQQGDGAWNLDTNPDNYYIDDDTERALLSIGSEFIVGNCRDGYTLYKRYDWGYISFSIADIGSVTTILTALNNITNPTVQPININGATPSQVNDVLANYEQPVVKVVTTVPPTSSNSGSCRNYVKDKGEHLFSSDRRISWKHKFKETGFLVHPLLTDKTLIKTYTKSFRKKKGRWKKYKSTISTGFTGKTVDVQCSNPQNDDIPNELTTKKRKKVKQRGYVSGNRSTQQNLLFSVHKQEGNTYENDIY